MNRDNWIEDQVDNADGDIDDVNENTWEQPINRTWDGVYLDDSGKLLFDERPMQREKRARMQVFDKPVTKGVIRNLYVIIDKSSVMEQRDMKPSRIEAVENGVDMFVQEFFDQNPLSHLGVIASYDGTAEVLTTLSGNPRVHREAVRDNERSGGAFSLQLCLEKAYDSLKFQPDYGTREILILMGALSTVDPRDINQTVSKLVAERVTCSIISVSADLYICRRLAKETLGTSEVALNKRHFHTLISTKVSPKAIPTSLQAPNKWIAMGFPQKRTEKQTPSLCSCHNKFSYVGFTCPRCQVKTCELPSDCKICGLTLVSAPHLARSYHHLFPVKPYVEVDDNDDTTVSYTCSSCRMPIDATCSLVLTCPSCKQIFCATCDIYVHESLHNCPGCL